MKKYIVLCLSLLFLLSLCTAKIYDAKLEILKQWLIIWTPANLSLWSVTAWNDVEQNFSSPFWIEDLRGISQWHYTTIQCDWLYQEWGDGVITWVQLSRWTWYFLIAGRQNGTKIDAQFSGAVFVDITSPQLFFYRNDGDHNNGAVNRYGVHPIIQVTVPAGTPSWTYKWKITYTLYDMSFTR